MSRIPAEVEHLFATERAGWTRVSGTALAAIVLGTLWVLWQALSGEQWVPLLDGANLLFHEAGHPLFGIFSERLTVYGGTLGQLVFPAVVLWHFWRRRESASAGVAALWLLENGLNIGRYMADARAQLLPLVGNGEHDWTEILGRWGMLQHDTLLAGLLRGSCVLGMLLVLAVLVYAWHLRRDEAGDV